MSKLLFYLLCLDFTLHCSSVTYGPKYKDLRTESPRARCGSFSKFARFQPYSVLDEPWKIFYYWGSRPASLEYVFRVPSIEDVSRLHTILDGTVEVPVNWTARQLLIRDSNMKTSLLVEMDDRGRYMMYRVLAEPFIDKEKMLHMDIRMKQKSGYIGIMFCNTTNAYVMARKSAVPRKNKIQDAAATMDIHMRRGQSYLYQGHHWMPVGEANDDKYFLGEGEDDSVVQKLVVPNEVEEGSEGAGREEFGEENEKTVKRNSTGKEDL